MKKSITTTTKENDVIDGKKKKSITTTTNYKNLAKKFAKEIHHKPKSFSKLNNIFRKKMQERNSGICFFHKFVIAQIEKNYPITPIEFSRVTEFSRNTFYIHSRWLLDKGFLVRFRGTSELRPTPIYQKCLKENVEFIANKCEEIHK